MKTKVQGWRETVNEESNVWSDVSPGAEFVGTDAILGLCLSRQRCIEALLVYLAPLTKGISKLPKE